MGDNSTIPKNGFAKTTQAPALTAQQKTLLIRKGNEFFNNGKYEEAKRIFLTVKYSDGLIRIGDYYAKKNNALEAIRMYWVAPEPKRVSEMAEKIAGVIRIWMNESKEKQIE